MPKWCRYVAKQTMDILHVFDPIYRKNFYICAGMGSAKFVRVMKKQINIDIPKPDGLGRFMVVEICGMNNGVIWSKDRGEILRHELLHASIWTLRNAGIEVNEHTEEALAYHTDFLFRCVTRK